MLLTFCNFIFFFIYQKEKDLELTARIGKELLTGNQTLEARVGLLETELKTVNERYTQASYELQKKNDLIKILSNDADETGYEASEYSFKLKDNRYTVIVN